MWGAGNAPKRETQKGKQDETIAEDIDANWPYADGWHVAPTGYQWDDDYEEHSVTPCGACGDRAHGDRYAGEVYR